MTNDLHMKYRDKLRGDQDVLLTDILQSHEFNAVTRRYLTDDFTGIYSLIGKVNGDDELGRKILACADEVSEVFKVSNQTAIKLLLRSQAPAAYGTRYVPRVRRDGDEIIIRIGQKTTIDDIKAEWHVVTGIQETMGGKSRKQSINPELYFCIYRQRVLRGRKMKDIFDDYRMQRLEGYDHPPTIDDEHEFRKRYNRVVRGL